jgi:hypothetical protein
MERVWKEVVWGHEAEWREERVWELLDERMR